MQRSLKVKSIVKHSHFPFSISELAALIHRHRGYVFPAVCTVHSLDYGHEFSIEHIDTIVMYSPRLAKFPCLTLVRCFHTRVTSSMLPRFLLHHLFVTGSMLPSLQRVPSSSLVPWYEVYNTSSVCHRFHATRDTFGSM